jgi:hypothetical protein
VIPKETMAVAFMMIYLAIMTGLVLGSLVDAVAR